MAESNRSWATVTGNLQSQHADPIALLIQQETQRMPWLDDSLRFSA